MKIGLFGKGKMGTCVAQLAPLQGDLIVDLEEAEVCIDFSHPTAVLDHVCWAASHQIPIVIGTTGWERDGEAVRESINSSTIAALFSPNFSLGVALFIQLLRQARVLLKEYDIAGVEYHHNQKKDTPSGTAIVMARHLEMQTPFASVRCGRIPGKHEVIFDSPLDSITLTHEAHNRESFASGALQAAHWIKGKKGWFTIDDMLRNLHSTHYPV